MIFWSPDSKGFPMLKVDPYDYWIHAFPITKLQFEQYLVANNSHGDNFYSELLDLNPRISLRRITPDCYEKIFITGVQLNEVNEFATWLSGNGNEYKVPTIKQWKDIYNRLLLIPRINRPYNWNDLDINAQEIWDQIFRLKIYSNLAEQLLLKNGVLEWVYEEKKVRSEFGGMGKPRSKFLPATLRRPTDAPLRPVDTQKRNTLRAFGFRLLRDQ